MSFESTQRPITVDERASLQKLIQSAPSLWRQAAENAGVLWAFSLFLIILSWGLVGWLAARLFDVGIGWKSSVALWFVPLSVVCTLGYAIFSTLLWIKPISAWRARLHADLAAGVVLEERLTFVAALCFQEPEHGGLIYFLRTSDDRVFTTYDHESQDLGVDDKDPLTSSFRPKSHLLRILMPCSRHPLADTFSGDVLPTDRVLELTLPPKHWPEPDAFIAVPWDEIERRFSKTS